MKPLEVKLGLLALLALLALVIVLTGCETEQHVQETMFVCNCEEQKRLQEFIAEGIKPANNMSDEEMEDVIIELRRSGTKVYCKQLPVYMIRTNNGLKIDWSKEKQDSCRIIMELW